MCIFNFQAGAIECNVFPVHLIKEFVFFKNLLGLGFLGTSWCLGHFLLFQFLYNLGNLLFKNISIDSVILCAC